MATLTTLRAAETYEIGERLGRLLHPGEVVSLDGTLGAGKTLLAKGLAQGIAAIPANEVTSPAYTLINEYCAVGKPPIFHMDFYRLEVLGRGDAEMIEEYLDNPRAIKIVEWGARLRQLPQRTDVSVSIEYGDGGDDCRTITIVTPRRSDRFDSVIDETKELWQR